MSLSDRERGEGFLANEVRQSSGEIASNGVLRSVVVTAIHVSIDD